MINSKHFGSIRNKTFRELNFSILNGEEGNEKLDRPLVVQFCGNDPQQVLESAKILEPYCDAVDINLGCPQDIAKRGYYGAYLQDDWDLIYRIINTLHTNLNIPVTAKFRVFPDVEKTVEYAKMLERAGAQILTCHGRTREQRGVNTGLADWAKIKAVKEAVSVPVFANGNILYYSDIETCLKATGADAVMSAEGNLYNPALFRPSLFATDLDLPEKGNKDIDISLEHLPITDLALEYLEIVKQQKTPTDWGAVKGHLFKLLRPGFATAVDLRTKMSKVPNPKGKPGSENDMASGLEAYELIVRELKERLQADMKAAEGTDAGRVHIDPSTGVRFVPHWLSQPYFRPAPPPPPPNKRAKADIKKYLDERKSVETAESFAL